MQNKLLIDGKRADKHYPLRTTDDIYNELLAESGEKQVSVNIIINRVLSPWAKAKKKKQLTKTKK